MASGLVPKMVRIFISLSDAVSRKAYSIYTPPFAAYPVVIEMLPVYGGLPLP